MHGWISLHRELLENPIVCKDTQYFTIWIYLLLQATHTEQDKIFKGNKIKLKRGQLITGRKTLANRFNISESKVQRILKTFQNEQQIEQQTSNKNRLITILNYDIYQNTEQQDKQPVNNKRTSTEQPVNTNNKDNNLNNENNELNYSVVLSTWNGLGFSKIRTLTDKRKKHIKARVSEITYDKFLETLLNLKTIKFFIDSKNENWFDFDWVINPNNFIKIIEGKYEKENNFSKKDEPEVCHRYDEYE